MICTNYVINYLIFFNLVAKCLFRITVVVLTVLLSSLFVTSICYFCHASNIQGNSNAAIFPIAQNFLAYIQQQGSIPNQYASIEKPWVNITFPAANSLNQNVSLKLKYEPNSNSVDGTFEIPDSSQDDADYVIFLFDSGNRNNISSSTFKSADSVHCVIKEPKGPILYRNRRAKRICLKVVLNWQYPWFGTIF